MDIVLGVSMAATTVRLLLIEGADADGVTIEEDTFDVGESASTGAVEQVIAAIDGTREGAIEGGYRLASIGVTWSDPAQVGALREELAAREVGGVMLVSPLLAAAALAQTVGHAIGYEHIAMLFVEPDHATLAVVEVSDGSIVDLHRRALANAHPEAPREALAAELATMVAALDARGSWADGVFLVGCGTEIVSIKPALEAVTPLDVTAPGEPEMALARGAALASANAPLFASSTAALAYALDPGTGEIHPRGLTPTYLDISANADLGDEALAYSAITEDDDEAPRRRRRPLMLTGSALAGIAAVAAGVVLLSLTSDRPVSAVQHKPRVSVAAPAKHLPPQAPAKPSPPSAPPPPAAAAPPPPPPAPVEHPAPHTPVEAPPPAPVYHRQAPRYVPTPVQRAVPAPPPAAPPPAPPAAVPPPPPAAAPAEPGRPLTTVYLHFPFVTVPIPIYPPPPPGP
ncbi:DUF7159 family protein [Mycobacterium servetii]|uniref:DUF7159 domain-containing protein n=1 Tax=Mycobacterium servetii TaxID=3237418 RepID=A0ABV4C7S1_9MYCO